MIPKPPRAGSGKVVSKVVKKGSGLEVEEEAPLEFALPDPQVDPSRIAMVGLSVSIGKSTEYAREKIEIGAWATLPTEADRASVEAQMALLKRFLAHEVEEALNEMGRRFFPEQWGSDNG